MNNEKLIKAAQSEKGKLIIEHLKAKIDELDLNKLAEIIDLDECLPANLKARALARKILSDEVRLLSGELKEEDSILNYLT